jgi:Peptidase C13 family
MDTVRLSLELTLEDGEAHRIGSLRRYRRTLSGKSWLIGYLPAIVMAIALTAVIASGGPVFPLWPVVGILLLWVVAQSAAQRYQARSTKPDKDSSFFGPCIYEFDADGLRTFRPGQSASYAWNKIRDIDRIGATLILWTERYSGIAVPLRGLPDDLNPEELERLLRSHVAPSTDRSTADPQRAGGSGFTPVLSALPRLWMLRGVANLQGVATDASVISLALASLALWVGLDGWRAGSGAQFELWDTLTISLYALLVLGLAFVLSRLSSPRLACRSVLFILVAGLPILIVVRCLIDALLDGRAALTAWALLCLYALAYSLKALRILSGAWQTRAPLVAVVLLCVFSAYGRVSDLSSSLWAPVPSEEEEGSDEMSASVAEGLLFDQRAQIDDAVDRMSAPAGSGPAVFFVGFAGVASQRVFAEEIKLAARVVGDRLDTSDRQLLLINDRRDIDTYPIATASGLSYALSAVAQKMNPERDILFLALSSHGSADPLLAVSNGSLQLEQLTGEDLDAALRDSGIKWRVIVISACYAGAFIKPLQNPDTIVITAAAADKTSFGCSDDRDMTYFGEAFYRDALPGAKTLKEAFERAKAAIAERETQEHETPSDPQAFFGEEISAVLDRNPMRTNPHREVHAAL